MSDPLKTLRDAAKQGEDMMEMVRSVAAISRRIFDAVDSDLDDVNDIDITAALLVLSGVYFQSWSKDSGMEPTRDLIWTWFAMGVKCGEDLIP